MRTVLFVPKPSFCALVFAAVIGSVVQPATSQVVFYSGFEYSAGEPTVEFQASALNGADGQIGLFSGSLPFGNGDHSGFLMGFEDNGGPNNTSRLLEVDRPLESGFFTAELSQTIPVDGARVSFEVGTRRSAGTTGIEHVKDYDIIGLDGAGNESFHVRVSAHSGDLTGEVQRLGVVSNFDADLDWDLPTLVGDDADGDLDNTGGSHNRGFNAAVELILGATGFQIDFENFMTDSRNPTPNAYLTDILPYNESATELSEVRFTFAGGIDLNDPSSTSFQGGYALDNIKVELIPEPNTVVLALIATVGACARPRRRVG